MYREPSYYSGMEKATYTESEILNGVYHMLMSQSFVDFYEGDFLNHVEGEQESMMKKDVIRELQYLISPGL